MFAARIHDSENSLFRFELYIISYLIEFADIVK